MFSECVHVCCSFCLSNLGTNLFLIFLKAVPHVMGLDGRPMPRKAIRTKKESDDKFWDFARQFFFGLWGFRQRPYPPGRPIDAAQAIGYKNLERRYYDCKFMGIKCFDTLAFLDLVIGCNSCITLFCLFFRKAGGV